MAAIYCKKLEDNERLVIVVEMEVPQQLSVEEVVLKNTCLESWKCNLHLFVNVA